MSSSVGARMYWVAAVGREDEASVVVAINEDEAVHKALQHPNIYEAVSQGCSINTWDLTKHFESLGYQIIISEKGLFH